MGKKLGDVLHAIKEDRASNDTWWEKFRTELVETAAALRIANMGTLLGPPTLLRQSEEKFLFELLMEVPPERDVSSMWEPLGETVEIEFSCSRSLPHPIEPEAVLWDVEPVVNGGGISVGLPVPRQTLQAERAWVPWKRSNQYLLFLAPLGDDGNLP